MSFLWTESIGNFITGTGHGVYIDDIQQVPAHTECCWRFTSARPLQSALLLSIKSHFTCVTLPEIWHHRSMCFLCACDAPPKHGDHVIGANHAQQYKQLWTYELSPKKHGFSYFSVRNSRTHSFFQWALWGDLLQEISVYLQIIIPSKQWTNNISSGIGAVRKTLNWTGCLKFLEGN